MNPARVAELFRALADEFDSTEAEDKPLPKPRRRANRAFVAPIGPVTDIEVARAQRQIRRWGTR